MDVATLEPVIHPQEREFEGGVNESDAWEKVPRTSAQTTRTSVSAASVENSSNMDRIEGSDSDITAGVDLDGFSALPFDDGVNMSIDYEPFGLLLDGI